MKLTSRFHLMPRLRISVAIPIYGFIVSAERTLSLPYSVINFLSWSKNCHVSFGVCTVYSSVRERFYEMK